MMRLARRVGMAVGLSALAVGGSPTAASADVPGGGIVRDVFDGAAGWAFEEVASGIATWVLGAVAFFIEGALRFLQSSARPQVEADWFAGPASPFAAVRNIAAVLLLAFAFLGILQGLLHGDVGVMVRQVVGKLPLAVVGMVVTVASVGKMLDLTDALSAAVLATTDDQALHFLAGFGATVTGATSGFAAVVLGLVAVLAALILWIELLVRSSLVYLLVAISPLGFAAMLWPSARGVLRRTLELLVAVILSKFVIAVALSIGVAALAGAGEATQGAGAVGEAASAGVASDAGAGLATLLVGSVVVGLAAFAPFIVLKLVPLAEGALAAHGVSRGPVRAVQSGASTYNSVSRLAGGHGAPRSGSRGSVLIAPPGGGATQAAAPAGGATRVAGGAAGFAAGAATAGIAGATAAPRRASAAADGAAGMGSGSRSQGRPAMAPTRPQKGGGE
jgi:type IV secretion system protein TrbL